MKLSIKDFFSKCDEILSKLRIWSHLLKKYLMENFRFRAVCNTNIEFQVEFKSGWKLFPSFAIDLQ